MGKKVLFVSPLPEKSNPAIDHIIFGLQDGCTDSLLDLHVVFDDFRKRKPSNSLPVLIDAAIAASYDAVVFYVVDPDAGGDATTRARLAGISVFSIARPNFSVNASLNYPGFNQGVFMMTFLTSLLPPGSQIGIIGGPNAVTDSEEVAGLVFAAKRSKCQLVNDPFDQRYSNLTDNAQGAEGPARRLLEEFPKIAGLAPYNDESMLGAMKSIAELGFGPMKMVSRNGSPAAVRAIREGKTSATWDLDPPGVGNALALLIASHLSGAEKFDDYAAMAPAGRLITSRNLDSWQPWEQRVRQTTLEIGI